MSEQELEDFENHLASWVKPCRDGDWKKAMDLIKAALEKAWQDGQASASPCC